MKYIKDYQQPQRSGTSGLLYALVGAFVTLICLLLIGSGVLLVRRSLFAPSSPAERVLPSDTPPPTPTSPPIDTPPPTFTPLPTSTPIPTDTPTPMVTLSPSELAKILSVLVTEDRGVPEAKEYDPNKPGPHRIVLLTAEGKLSDFQKSLPEKWRPSTIGETELVAILTRQQEVVASATYNNSGGACPGLPKTVVINRIRLNTFAVIKEAKTGKIVVSQLFKGSDPPSFGWSVKCVKASGFFGEPVPFTTIYQWLMGYVKP